jgi:hypothetical protein
MSGDGGKFVMIWLSVLDAGLTPHALAAYCAIARHADNEGLAWPSMKTIAFLAKISKSKAKEAVKELTEKGLLTSVERRRPDGSPDSSLYRLANPARGGSRGDLPRSRGDRGVGHTVTEGGSRGGPELEPIEQEPKELTQRRKAAAVVVELPSSLNTPEFHAAWQEWQQHRREIRKPMTPVATKQQLKALEALGPDRAVIAINRSIANGWQGLVFEQKADSANGPAKPAQAIHRAKRPQKSSRFSDPEVTQ